MLPTIFIQLITAYVFFDRHWDDVTRRMSNTLAGEMAFFVRQLKSLPSDERKQLALNFQATTGIDVVFDTLNSYEPERETNEFLEFQQRLHAKISEPFTVRKNKIGTSIEIVIKLDDEVLRMETTVKRLESRTTIIFLVWMIGTSVFFLFIATLFLRNQIRPIRKLAEAADGFGRGVDMPDFKPSGASEVRKAARAFIVMRERIKRQLRTRTEMLAGISHDLRTPLTRMKLELAMLPPNEAIKELGGDVQQMEHMIAEYLDFARGDGGEEAARISLNEFLEDVVSDYHRLSADVMLTSKQDVMADIRVSSFRRMLHNLIDNAMRYGRRCELSLRVTANYCEIVIDDEGPVLL